MNCRTDDPAATSIGRRHLLLAATAALAASTVPTRAATGAQPAGGELPTAGVRFDDGLAVAFDATPSLGQGKELALVLGGGGEYFAAWMLGFVKGLHENGVPYEKPDVSVLPPTPMLGVRAATMA